MNSEQLHKKYGWPLKIHSRGYDAYLTGIQSLTDGEMEPIYRFPGGDNLVDYCEMFPGKQIPDNHI